MNRYNFRQLLTERLQIRTNSEEFLLSIDGIQIPMIQRDYAQGRDEEGEIRDRFLGSLFGAMCAGRTLELDFVYGAIKSRDGQHFFIPLDGQQRLTTLFLLHWYIGQRELGDDELMVRQQELSRFSYDTRTTARDFCRALCKMKRLDFSGGPAAFIGRQTWFFSVYEKDPTVKSMLTMLDAIHNNYCNASLPLYDQLSNLCFYILPLDGFGLTDELYIKMNARGKPLTDFENFKADLINWMNDKDNPERDLFLQQVCYNGRMMPYAMTIGLKLDNEWTNFFWSYSKDSRRNEDKLVDHLFLRFFDRLALNNFIQSAPLRQEALERSDLFVHFYAAEQRSKHGRYSNFGHYRSLIGSFDIVQKIERILDRIAVSYDVISKGLSPAWDPDLVWHFFGEEISQTQRILFMGMCSYLEKDTFELKGFQQWIRVVWNIIINPDIRSIQAMISAMKLISEMGAYATEIYEFLASDRSLALEKQHRNTEFIEEREKAVLILQNQQWEDVLISGERHPLFLGSIGFLLDGGPSMHEFQRRLALATELFDADGAHGRFGVNYLLMRSLIASIHNFQELQALKMEDSQSNWSLLLRRNATCKRIIGGFCDAQDVNVLISDISSTVSRPSAIARAEGDADLQVFRFTHEQLYQQIGLHAWMQKANAVALVWKDNHLYVKKYRAWYDMVMLDTYRNFLIDRLISDFNLVTKNRCAETSYFWGDVLELELKVGEFVITVHFDRYQTLFAGLTQSKNLQIPASLQYINAAEYWHWVLSFNYAGLHSELEAVELCGRIGFELFDAENPKSLLSMLNVHLADPVPS
ncbi:DUF262 domain-containing protein [Pedobacter sp. GR22-6]|uniref:DUF262 domain-containing protein n=1 Tax=Pedobacter sp. GR22-6 TaxID=3127957 RepID=UPI00307D98CC